MDEEESASSSISVNTNGKAKKLRKGRPPKVKQSADIVQTTDQGLMRCETDRSKDTLEPFTVNDNTSETNVAAAKEEKVIKKQFKLKLKEKPPQTETQAAGNRNANNKNENDNLLMPPPAQPDEMQIEMELDPLKCNQKVEEAEEFQDNEMIMDGFSIFCFDSSSSVEVALKATGKGYENRRLLIDQSAFSKSPKLPSRDSRSPTGRKARVKTPAKPKEPKTPKSGKKSKKSTLALGTSPLALGKSPLALGTSSLALGKSPLALETTSCGSSRSTPETSKIKKSSEEVKPLEMKEEITMTLSDFAQLPNQSDGSPFLKSSKVEPAPINAQIKSEMKVEPNSHQHNQAENKPIKQENVENEGINAATSNTPLISNPGGAVTPSTSSVTSTPPALLPTSLATFNAPKFCSAEATVTNPADLGVTGLNAPSKSSSSPASRTEGPRITTDLQGSDPVPWPGSRGGSGSHTAVTGSSTSAATAAATAYHPPTPSLQSSTYVPPVVSTRSSSVQSVTSSNGRRATPVCTSSVSSTSRDRENSGGSSRTASRSSDRNNSRSSQPPVTSSADSFSATVFGNPPYGSLNPAMLSFGPNGMAPPFNYTGGPGLTPSSGFPFGGPEMIPPFSHSSPMAAANQEAMRAEFSRRLLMQSGERSTLAPYLRPDQLFPAGPPVNNTPPLFLQMLEKNMPKMDPMQQAMFISQQRTAMAAAGVSGATSMSATPVSGPSPFQSVPGGHHNPGSSPENAQKKSGKWCNAHVRIAYYIMNARNNRRSEEVTNGVVTTASSHSNTENKTLSHSISAITSNVHRPRDIPPSSTPRHLQPNPMPSPGRPLDARKQASSSPLHRSEKNRSRSTASNPGSPARVPSPSNMPKDLSISNRSMPNGTLSVPSPKDMRWNKTHSTPQVPSTSGSSPAARKREQEERDKKCSNFTSQGAINPNGKRPSSNLAYSNSKKHRSHSRSPPRPAHSKLAPPRHSNGLTADSRLLPQASASDFQQRQFLNNMFSGMMNDNKAVPTNGYSPNSAAAAAAMFHPYLHSTTTRELENQRERERLYGPANPALALASLVERERQSDRTAIMLEYERARASGIYNPALSGLNGFHNNPLSNLGSIQGMGGPPPLIPASQAKVNLPSVHHTSPSHTLTNTSNGAVNDRYPR